MSNWLGTLQMLLLLKLWIRPLRNLAMTLPLLSGIVFSILLFRAQITSTISN